MDEDAVIEWRFDQLLAMGYSTRWALYLSQTQTSTHELQKLINAGCSPEIAARILVDDDLVMAVLNSPLTNHTPKEKDESRSTA